MLQHPHAMATHLICPPSLACGSTLVISDGNHRQVRAFASKRSSTFVSGASFASPSALRRRSSAEARRGSVGVRAETGNGSAKGEQGEVIEFEIDRPYGIKFYRGADGGIYIDALTPGYPGALSGKLQEGDKLLATSAVFGDEMWPAAEYGRTMYCIQQRVGPMVMRFEKRNGEKIGWFRQEAYLQERAEGNYGDAIRDKQLENYTRKLDMEAKRKEQVETGLSLYSQGKYEEALKTFQAIMGMSPEYNEQGVAFYNIACCCSKLGQTKAGLDALEAAMKSGFDDYKKIREDSDLSNLRNSDDFDDVMAKYDEPFLNENALKALSGVFGMFGRK